MSSIQKIHFIGIGGIGMSALARMCLLAGKEVSGSDMSRSEITESLEKEGARIFYAHAKENISEGVSLVVHTHAIPRDNPELLEAKRRDISTKTYPEFLGAISKNKYTIAVSGTHGKTTTTGMIAEGAIAAGLQPTVVIGSLLRNQKSNFIGGAGKYLIAEACEYKRSFLNLSPQVLVVTNIDNDHMDYYKDIADIQSAFAEFAANLPHDGFLVCDAYDPLLAPVIAATPARTVNYRNYFDGKIALKVPGAHNKKNAAAALAALDCLGVKPETARVALQKFAGTWRRFEYKGETKHGAILYDDYAHHPTEIKATLRGTREMFPDKKIIVAFQPHLYSRTKLLFEEFAASFGDADEVFLAPIYAAREPHDSSVSLKTLAQKIAENGTTAHVSSEASAKDGSANNFEEIASILNAPRYGKDHLLITMGAGDVFKVGEFLIK
ncbi:MAG: UDP-N-acetylmuramate--L-alanine ligase [Parcubacteria group bacterium]|nr:UDP-N-acetylmuramate--L-alanine ligase [Parcubacteria group bacterium]